jgi:hypothetical protein
MSKPTLNNNAAGKYAPGEPLPGNQPFLPVEHLNGQGITGSGMQEGPASTGGKSYGNARPAPISAAQNVINPQFANATASAPVNFGGPKQTSIDQLNSVTGSRTQKLGWPKPQSPWTP